MLRTNSSLEALVDTDLDTLATALYVTTDDLLRAHPERVPPRPRIGIAPRTSDATENRYAGDFGVRPKKRKSGQTPADTYAW